MECFYVKYYACRLIGYCCNIVHIINPEIEKFRGKIYLKI